MSASIQMSKCFFEVRLRMIFFLFEIQLFVFVLTFSVIQFSIWVLLFGKQKKMLLMLLNWTGPSLLWPHSKVNLLTLGSGEGKYSIVRPSNENGWLILKNPNSHWLSWKVLKHWSQLRGITTLFWLGCGEVTVQLQILIINSWVQPAWSMSYRHAWSQHLHGEESSSSQKNSNIRNWLSCIFLGTSSDSKHHWT